ncbi:MAG: alpha/beta fold hydrolase, partial [Bacteroidota bacterium]
MKQKILLLHGALGSRKQFTALAQELESTYEVHTLNFEGHGGSVSSSEFSMAVFSKNVIDYLDAKNIQSAAVFGYS